MDKYALLYGGIIGLTVVIFPASWRRNFAQHTHFAAQRRFWAQTSLWTFRFMGLAVIGFCVFCAVHY